MRSFPHFSPFADSSCPPEDVPFHNPAPLPLTNTPTFSPTFPEPLLPSPPSHPPSLTAPNFHAEPDPRSCTDSIPLAHLTPPTPHLFLSDSYTEPVSSPQSENYFLASTSVSPETVLYSPEPLTPPTTLRLPSPPAESYKPSPPETPSSMAISRTSTSITKRYKCGSCGEGFPSLVARRQHTKQEHPKRFVCTTCSAVFTRRCDLVKHGLTIHERMRPFICELCPMAFGQRHHLGRHKRVVHEKKRPYNCSRCTMRFGRKDHLRNHEKAVHGKGKVFSCPLCDAKCVEKGGLRLHLETEHYMETGNSSSGTLADEDSQSTSQNGMMQ